MGTATVIPVKQRTPEWREARFDGIGASEAAAAIGVSPWQSPVGLWAEKLRLVPPATETLPMRIGSELEPLIARLYQEATGAKVRRVSMLRQHPTHRFMLASLDRRAGKRPVELKYSLRGIGYGEPGTDEVPDDVLVQVLHQLAVMDEDEADVAAIIGGRPEVQIYTIRRDPAAEAAIVEREALFWDHVQSRTEPPLDGSEATLRALAAIYPRDDGESIEIPAIATDSPVRAALARLEIVRTNLKVEETRKAELEAEIKAFMGTASRLVVPGVGEVTWKVTKDRETTDWKAYALALETVVRGLTAESRVDVAPLIADARARHTETKPGPRVFRPKFEEE